MDEIIIRLVAMGDDPMADVKKPADAQLSPSEVVIIGLLFALKGGTFRAFYRWLKANHGHLFQQLNERTRLGRLLVMYRQYTDEFLAEPSFFTVFDTFWIELIYLLREGRSQKQLRRKMVSNGRWIVGIKVAWLINDQGHVVDWAWDDASEADNAFNDIAQQHDEQTITLGDMGFRKQDMDLRNLKICEQGHWNERFLIETLYSFVGDIVHSKKQYHRDAPYFTAHLDYLAALVNCLLRITNGALSFKDVVL